MARKLSDMRRVGSGFPGYGADFVLVSFRCVISGMLPRFGLGPENHVWRNESFALFSTEKRMDNHAKLLRFAKDFLFWHNSCIVLFHCLLPFQRVSLHKKTCSIVQRNSFETFCDSGACYGATR